MKSKKMKTFKMALILVGVTLLSGCVDTNERPSYDYTLENGGAYKGEIGYAVSDGSISNEMDVGISTEEMAPEFNAPNAPSIADNDAGEPLSETLKIVSTFNMMSESKDFDDDVKQIEKEIHNLDGYITSHNIRVNHENKIQREANIGIKVPKENINNLISFVKDNVLVIEESSDAIDITDRFYDTKSHIKNLESQEIQLRELYKKANKIEDVILINDRLAEVTKEKEMFTRSFMGMKDKVEYARINVKIKEVQEFTIMESLNDTTPTRMIKALSNSLARLKFWIINIMVFMVGLLPIGVLAGIGYLIYIKFLKKFIDKINPCVKHRDESHKNN